MPAGAASCCSVGKQPLHPMDLASRVSVPPSKDLPLGETRGPRMGGGPPRGGSGGCASSRAWRRQMRIPEAGAEAGSEGWAGQGEGGYLWASLPLATTTHARTHATCHLLWPPWKLQKKTGSGSPCGACEGCLEAICPALMLLGGGRARREGREGLGALLEFPGSL